VRSAFARVLAQLSYTWFFCLTRHFEDTTASWWGAALHTYKRNVIGPEDDPPAWYSLMDKHLGPAVKLVQDIKSPGTSLLRYDMRVGFAGVAVACGVVDLAQEGDCKELMDFVGVRDTVHQPAYLGYMIERFTGAGWIDHIVGVFGGTRALRDELAVVEFLCKRGILDDDHGTDNQLFESE